MESPRSNDEDSGTNSDSHSSDSLSGRDDSDLDDLSIRYVAIDKTGRRVHIAAGCSYLEQKTPACNAEAGPIEHPIIGIGLRSMLGEARQICTKCRDGHMSKRQRAILRKLYWLRIPCGFSPQTKEIR